MQVIVSLQPVPAQEDRDTAGGMLVLMSTLYTMELPQSHRSNLCRGFRDLVMVVSLCGGLICKDVKRTSVKPVFRAVTLT
jgi:hypothetical protein